MNFWESNPRITATTQSKDVYRMCQYQLCNMSIEPTKCHQSFPECVGGLGVGRGGDAGGGDGLGTGNCVGEFYLLW